MSIWDRLFGPKSPPRHSRPTQQAEPRGGGSGTRVGIDKISALIAELIDNPDSKARLKAAIELSRNPSEASTSALIRGLKDSAANVRGCCAESLRMLKDSKAVEPLIEILLTDTEHGPVYYAAKALGTIRTPRAVEALVAALEQRKGDISELCLQLGEIQAPAAVEPLISAVKDRENVSSYARRHAVMALEKIGDPRAKEALQFALDDSDEGVRTRAENALRVTATTQSSEIRAGDCCEICRRNFRDKHSWGLECGGGCISKLPNSEDYDIAARYCHKCVARMTSCPQCGGRLLNSIL